LTPLLHGARALSQAAQVFSFSHPMTIPKRKEIEAAPQAVKEEFASLGALRPLTAHPAHCRRASGLACRNLFQTQPRRN